MHFSNIRKLSVSIKSYPISIIVLITLTLYFPILKFDFLYGWDDQWFVTNHYTESGINPKNVYAILSEYYYGQYAPVNQLYYTSIFIFFSYNPAVYHALSLFLHLGNCILMYLFLKSLFRDIKIDPKSTNEIAFLAILIFAVLPINVEAVSWVAASKVLLYTLFYLIALKYYIQYIKIHHSKPYYLCLVSGIISFGAKEQAVLLPFSLLLLDYLYDRKISDINLWIEKLPFFILSVFLGIVTIESQQIEVTNFYTIKERVPLFFFTLTEYLTKIIIPINLSYLYPFPFLKGEDIPLWLWVHVISIPIISICFLKYLKNKIIMFAVIFFLIHIMLVSNTVSLARYSLVADRYAYLSALGICVLLAYLFRILTQRNTRSAQKVKFFGLVYFLFLVYTSVKYIPVWQNAHTLKNKLKITIENRSDFKRKITDEK